MSRAMYRYVIPVDDGTHVCGLTGEPVAVAATPDGDFVQFWAEHISGRVVQNRAFRVFGTGHPLPPDAIWVGTCPRIESGLIWHLYEVTP